jgi:hypothetical protein
LEGRRPWNVFSAKGAAFTASLGQRPRSHVTQNAPALKAPFTSLISTGIIFGRVNPRGIETRFQRLMYQQSDTWGDAPG